MSISEALLVDVGDEEGEDVDQDETGDDWSVDSSDSEDESSVESIMTSVKPAGMHWMDDTRRMNLTLDEVEDALVIKSIIESIDEIDNLSDFAYCQLALVKGSDIEGAVKMARHLQIFRQEYNVLDTEADGRRCLRRFLQLAPRMFLHFGYQDNTTVATFCQDGRPNDLTTPEKVIDWIVGHMYMHHTFCPDFESIREGVTVHMDCHSYHWNKHVDLKVFRRVWDEVLRAYPFKTRCIGLYHAGLMFNMVFAMVKKACPSEWLLGAQTCEAPGFLDDIFLQPTVEAANDRLLAAWDDSLRRRYENESTFSLASFECLLPSADELAAAEDG